MILNPTDNLAFLGAMNSFGLPPPKPQISPLNLNSTSKALASALQWRRRSQFFQFFPILRRKRAIIHAATALLQQFEHDVVVVGAGIIGLSIARQLLLQSGLSVAVVDAGLPCSGATGAGQGYIWMAHRTPGSDTWELALRSKHLWEDLAESVRRTGLDPLQVLGWNETGSLLIGRTSKERAILEERVMLLSHTGLRAEFLSANSLLSREPALEVGKEGCAAFFPDDCQIDAFKTVSFIEKGNKCFASGGRYAEFYNDPALCLEINTVHDAIRTSKNILHFKKALVIAAGAWSGCLMQSLFVGTDIVPVPVKPRKGHLIVLDYFNGIQLNHGLMEVGYIIHQCASSQPVDNAQHLSSVSMTATIDMNGNLVLGSSREFSEFSKEVDKHIVKSILERAAEFLPALNDLLLQLNENGKIKVGKVGFRPYMPDGKPVIGPVLRLPKVFLATGHEGSGLSLALGTAEMVADMILDNQSRVDCKPFSVQGRFSY